MLARVYQTGRVCGYLTSVSFGHTVGRCVGLGYVRKCVNRDQGSQEDCLVTPEWMKAGHYEIEIASKRVPASVSLQPVHDPKNERVRV